jgi:spore coat protein CotH
MSSFEDEILPKEKSNEPDNEPLNSKSEESCKVSKMMKEIESCKPFEDSDQEVGNHLVERLLAEESVRGLFWAAQSASNFIEKATLFLLSTNLKSTQPPPPRVY